MRCYRCMKEFNKEYEICPHCGYINSTDSIEPFQLPPGTMLQERYWIGMMIGFGGFGITYKAYDTKLNVIVAIKEYYPAGLVNRVYGSTRIQNNSNDRISEFDSGLEHFIEEARNIAKFSEHSNIVKVYHFFRENHTGYIVMEYLDGISMKYFLEVNGGKTSILYAKEIVLAIAQALKALHKEGILHRDVSPDNIFLCSDGKIKLIDFGSSRLSKNREGERDVIVKPGYAPPEQYEKQGNQGTWTDVYALGATFYRAVTGQVPIESVDRQRTDCMIQPCEYDVEIPVYVESIILKAMALDVKDRFEKVEDLEEVLLKRKVVAIPKSAKQKKERRQQLVYNLITTAVVFIFGVLLWKYIDIRQDRERLAGKSTIMVVYTLQPENIKEETFTIENFDNTTMYYGNGELDDTRKLQEFAEGKMLYLCGDEALHDEVSEAVYGTYEQPREEVQGLLRMIPLEDN